MPIYSLAKAGEQIIVGQAVVSQGDGPPAYYHDASRALVWASGDSLSTFENLDGRFLGGDWPQSPPISDDSDVSFGASGVANTITYAAHANRRHIIGGVSWAYYSTPTNGSVTIKDGDDVIFSTPVTTAGADNVSFPEGKMGTKNTAMTITLGAAGSTVSGVLSVHSHRWG